MPLRDEDKKKIQAIMDEHKVSEEAAKAILAAGDDAVDGLTKNRDDLLAENSKNKEAIKAAEAKAKESAEKIAELEKQIEDAGEGDDDEKSKLEKRLEKMEQERQKDKDALAEAQKQMVEQTQGNALNMQLSTALEKNNVTNPTLKEAAIGMIKTKADVVFADGDVTGANITLDGKAVADYVNDFTSGDDGKAFVTAAGNSGGGAKGTNDDPGGGSGAHSGKSMSGAEFNALDDQAKEDFVTNGGEVIA